MDGLPFAWGTVGDEHARSWPVDALVPAPALLLTRAVPVAAPPALVWRWVCQLALAPYSYDLVDNLGRRSPQELVPGTDDLVPGQRMATVFELVELVPGRAWTGVSRPSASRVLGRFATTYAVEPVADAGACRLVCRLAVSRRGPLPAVRAGLLAWGDLVMMRRQLHNLRGLAQRDAQRDARRDVA